MQRMMISEADTPTSGQRLVGQTLISLLALCLVGALASCDAVGAPSASGAHPTATTQPAPDLVWRTITLPTAALALDPAPSQTVAVGDGSVAYLCVTHLTQQNQLAAVTGGEYGVWATHDTGVAWLRMADLPVTPSAVTVCSITIDDSNPQIAVATIHSPFGSNLPEITPISFTTFDGGAHWTPAVGDATFRQLASLGATFYAIRSVGYAFPQLYTSDDHMQTWRRIDESFTGVGDPYTNSIRQFALNMLTGEVAVTANNLLWFSRDAGASWQSSAPTTTVQGTTLNVTVVFAQPAVSGRPWLLCAALYTQTIGLSGMNGLICSTDGGKTWASLTGLNLAIPCPGCAKADNNVIIASATPLGVTAQGTILAMTGQSYASDGAGETFEIAQLARNALQWQAVGSLTTRTGREDGLNPSVTLAATGQLWYLNTTDQVANLA